ncbi:MAG: PD40 domain-containing protein [Bacteroidales bacterium]|nr:PD40 domain-containing protein [Bacteroidales bacterium]
MKKLLTLSLMLLIGLTVSAQQEAKMLRFPTIHGNDVVFTHGGDLYKVDVKGGVAHKLTNDVDGYEMFARFSPDGKHLAFTGQYDGNTEVYVMPYPECGTPTRLTYTATLSRDDVSDRMGPNNIVMTWKDNENIVFRSRKQSWDDFVGQLFVANIEGGIAEQLPLPEGGWISYSPDGKKIAYNRVMREFRTWKYYKGGMADDVWIFDFKSKKIENITNNNAQDIFPMWVGDKVYFCSDRDRTMNLFVFDTKTKQTSKVTDYTYYDIKYPSLGDNDIVYENGGELFRYNLKDGKIYPIPVQIVDDGNSTRNKYVDCSKFINSSSIAPDGKRVAFGARGDVWTVPAKSGITRNLTQSDGVHDRNVAWSPDGKYIAYISDRTGEDEIYIQSQDGKEEAVQLTDNSDTYKMGVSWSPDSKYVTWYDKMNQLNIVEISSKKVTVVAENKTGEMRDFAWSADSRWIAYTMPSTFGVSQIHIYNVASGKDEVVTEELFNASSPTFDKNGKYLYFTSERDFRPTYSWTEWNHVYTDMTRIYLITLQKDTPSPFLTENDEVMVDGEKTESKDEPKKEAPKEVKIDFEGITHRIVVLPVNAGSYYNLNGVMDGLYYVAGGRNSGGLGFFDAKTKKCTNIGSNMGYQLTADGSKMLVRERGSYKIINAPKGPMPGGGSKEGSSGNAKDDGSLDLSQMKKWVSLKEEWTQILNEAWRQERDFFYAPNMHGVDWPAMKEKYGKLVPYCSDRYDLTYLIGEMIGEINIGHAYVGDGDRLKPERIKLGLLGAQIHRDKSGYFQIDKILKGENWNEKTRSPLTEVGIDVKEGDYIISIDGQSTKEMKDMYKALVGKANTPVLLTINGKASEGGSHDVVVKPIADENGLYYYNMVQDNIEKVNKATNGQVGYIHIPDMGVDGLNEFAKYFYPQLDKKALIIDDRGNGGGNVSPMIIERLRRELSMYDMMRNCEPETKPTKMVLGPKVLLFNKYSASDGDLFPYQFKKHKIGTTIGTRSWGGVVGIRGSLPFIDGGTLTRPEFAPFDEKGNWVIEGYGVDPDIVIDNDPAREFEGIDDQLNKAIEVILKQMKDYPEIPAIPAFPDKSK